MTTVFNPKRKDNRLKKKKPKPQKTLQTKKPNKNQTKTNLKKTQTKAIPTSEEGHNAQAIMPVHKFSNDWKIRKESQ